MGKRRSQPRRNIYQEVTDKIIAMLDRGTAPWRCPIRRRGGGGQPMSLGSKKPYRGINTFLLAVTADFENYQSDYWLTFNQARTLGGQVRKGEKGTLVIFWKQHAVEDVETGEPSTVPVLRHYSVFNADQVDGVQPPDAAASDEAATPFEPLAEAERIVAGYAGGPTIAHRGSQACYLPREDRVEIALPERFDSRESYYATLFHELAHSTGAKGRLDRSISERVSPFGSPDYSHEELVAEMGSAFLAAAAGISPPTIEQSAAYIDGWRKKLSSDNRLVIQAAAQGQRAADHILGVTFE